jgi:hypothetical protein
LYCSNQCALQVGPNHEYVSIPDMTVDIHIAFHPFVGSSLIIVKDKLHVEDALDVNGNKVTKTSNRAVKNKPNLSQLGEFQLPGEMVATVMHNFTN